MNARAQRKRFDLNKIAWSRTCLGWHRFELEVNGDVLGSFDFEVTGLKDKKPTRNR